jgi:hypothetical protein
MSFRPIYEPVPDEMKARFPDGHIWAPSTGVVLGKNQMPIGMANCHPESPKDLNTQHSTPNTSRRCPMCGKSIGVEL